MAWQSTTYLSSPLLFIYIMAKKKKGKKQKTSTNKTEIVISPPISKNYKPKGQSSQEPTQKKGSGGFIKTVFWVIVIGLFLSAFLGNKSEDDIGFEVKYKENLLKEHQ